MQRDLRAIKKKEVLANRSTSKQYERAIACGSLLFVNIIHSQTEAAKAEHLRRVCECGEPCPSPDPSKCSLCHNAGICAKDPEGCSLCKEAAEKVRARTQALWLLPHLLIAHLLIAFAMPESPQASAQAATKAPKKVRKAQGTNHNAFASHSFE